MAEIPQDMLDKIDKARVGGCGPLCFGCAIGDLDEAIAQSDLAAACVAMGKMFVAYPQQRDEHEPRCMYHAHDVLNESFQKFNESFNPRDRSGG